jgi:hypothetical protein
MEGEGRREEAAAQLLVTSQCKPWKSHVLEPITM